MFKKGCIILLLALILLPSVNADNIIANSPFWEDIYSSGMYSIMEDQPFQFLVSPRHSETITVGIDKNIPTIILEAERAPFIKNYEDRLKIEDYNVETIKFPDKKANIELAKRLDTNKFIVIDPTYGYDAISVVSYAKITRAYVLFANKENIQEIKDYLGSKSLESLIIYGDVDNEVKQELAKFNPEIIDEGNRYKNNIKIAERYRKLTDAKQVLLTNGELLESSIFTSGSVQQPIVFIGKDRPPEVTMNYLANAGYKTAVLIGNDLIKSSRYVKDNSDISVFIKFGKGITGGEAAYKGIQGLDIIRIPFIELLLRLQNVFYNSETQQLELLLNNEREAKTYLINNLVVKADNEPIITLVSDGVELIDDLETKGYIFDADLTEHLDKNLSAEVLIPYGYAEEVLDTTIDITVPIQIISESDKCNVEILNANYNTITQRFELELESQESCYVLATIRNLIIADQEINPQSDVERINGIGNVNVKQRMDEVDIADNDNIRIEIRYGTRKEVLSQIKIKDFPLETIKKRSFDLGLIIKTQLLLGIIAILLLLFYIYRNRQQPKSSKKKNSKKKGKNKSKKVTKDSKHVKKKKVKSTKKKPKRRKT